MNDVEQFDLLVIAGGKGGKTLAMDMAHSGRRVAMVERSPEMVGGTCINLACIPTKTLIRSAEVAHLAHRAGDFGVRATLGTQDAPLLRSRKDGVVEAMRQMNLDQFHSSGMELVIGTARFVAPRRVRVNTETGTRVLQGDHAVVDLGTRPAIPPIAGLAEAAPLTSESLLALERLPAHLVVLGGGYVGLELAQAMHRFGSRVTIVERSSQLLGREDKDVAQAVASILSEDGIEVLLDTSVRSVERLEDGSVRIEAESASGPQELRADEVLAALGRTPATDDVGLDDAGVELDERGFVRVDGRLRTTERDTFAIGDVTGGPQFTHVSLDDYRVVKSALTGGSRHTGDRMVPYTVFLDPELGRVGLTEREAEQQGHDFRVTTLPTSAVPRAKTLGSTRGLLKAVIDRKNDRILGVAILAPHGGEVAAVVQMAMMGGLPASTLKDAVLAHPTMAEALNQLFAA